MSDLAGKVLKMEIVRFGIVGVAATAIHYGIYLLLKQVMDINISYTIGYLISLACNFFLTAKFTFQTKTSVKRGAGFIASHVVNYFLHLALLNLFVGAGIPGPYCIQKILILAITISGQTRHHSVLRHKQGNW